jgi:hypothetical protein
MDSNVRGRAPNARAVMADPPTSVAAKRGDADSKESTNVHIPAVGVFFQRFPGVVGDDAARGIANVPFKIRVDGAEYKVQATATDARGFVIVPTPVGSKVELEIFDTVFAVTRVGLEKLDAPVGVQRRLDMLGYEPGRLNGVPSYAFDAAMCAYQTDAGLERNGLLHATEADGAIVGGQLVPTIKTASDLIDDGKTLPQLDADIRKK